MKILSNRLVPHEWKMGNSARNHNNTFYTDGKGIFSYNLLIGTTTSANYKIAYNYTKGSDNFISQTTSQHVRYVEDSADFSLHPRDIKNT